MPIGGAPPSHRDPRARRLGRGHVGARRLPGGARCRRLLRADIAARRRRPRRFVAKRDPGPGPHLRLADPADAGADRAPRPRRRGDRPRR